MISCQHTHLFIHLSIAKIYTKMQHFHWKVHDTTLIFAEVIENQYFFVFVAIIYRVSLSAAKC